LQYSFTCKDVDYKKKCLKKKYKQDVKMMNKELFREHCKLQLQSAKRDKIARDARVLESLEKLLLPLRKKTILFYLPLATEVRVNKLFQKLRRHNNLLVPFMEGVSFKVVKFRLPLYKKKFSILEPANSWARISNIDIAVVPVVGVDGKLRRIGHGKGMYDRFFSSLKCPPYVIFVQRATCFSKHYLGQAHDMQADIYITPNDIIKRRGNHGIRTYDRRRRSLNKRCDRVPCR
jgi:5-formyltetrahydrofolate cyclo-ligase